MASSNKVSQQLAKRYAKAVFEIAQENKILDKVADDLDAIVSTISESESLKDALNNATIPTSELEEVAKELASKAKYTETVANLLVVLAKSRRLAYVPSIKRAYDASLRESKNEELATIISASSLTKAQLDSITKRLTKAVGKTVIANNKVDESLLGGIKIHIGSKMLDASVRGRLEQLTVKLKHADIAA